MGISMVAWPINWYPWHSKRNAVTLNKLRWSSTTRMRPGPASVVGFRNAASLGLLALACLLYLESQLLHQVLGSLGILPPGPLHLIELAGEEEEAGDEE